LLGAAQRAGYQIRVAVVASQVDLGSVTELWRQPQTYARFLAQELGLVYRGPLLVLMPNGVGFQQLQGRSVGLPAGIRTLLPGPRMGAAAITAVRQLAAASGHPLALPSVRVRGTSTGRTIEDVVFVVGLVICSIAWILSVRDRPLRIGHNRSAPAR
jgi:hypothetical protein